LSFWLDDLHAPVVPFSLSHLLRFKIAQFNLLLTGSKVVLYLVFFASWGLGSFLAVSACVMSWEALYAGFKVKFIFHIFSRAEIGGLPFIRDDLTLSMA
jgi:hypothetical protein